VATAALGKRSSVDGAVVGLSTTASDTPTVTADARAPRPWICQQRRSQLVGEVRSQPASGGQTYE